MRNDAAAADVTVALIPALDGSGGSSSAVPLAGSSSSSSSSALVPPGKRIYSVLQVLLALFYGAPAILVAEDGHRAGAEETIQVAVQGRVRRVIVGTMNSYLRACGRIPMVCPEGSLDLNAALAPPHASQLSPPERGLPVICAHCNCGFCFGVYEVPWLNPPPGYAYPDPPVPATADLLTPPPVEPLYGDRALQGTSATRTPVALLRVCSDQHHFMVTMGMLRLPHDAPSLVWRRPSSLGVLPTVVGSADGGGSRRHLKRRATAPPPPGPWASARANPS